jgi:ATP-dependent DNA helicase DinG
VLAAAVAEIGGHERTGQLQLAASVGDALDTGVHLLAQAGTGTGKSLGYLAPVLVRLARGDLDRVVVTTATLALQSQLASKDIPSALDAVEQVTGRRPTHAILKGRTNYACLLKVRDGAEDQAALIPASELVASLQDAPRAAPESALGAEVLALREWAEEQLESGGMADRDDAPTHTERGWQQVSIPVRECLGTQQCPQGGLCFVEKSRETARSADLVVTNHALLAIDAMHGGTALPEHQAVVIDEAHELTARVTGAASAELSPGIVERVARRALTWLDDDDLGAELLTSADRLRDALEEVPLERVEDPGSVFVAACEGVRSVTRRVVSALTTGGDKNEPDCRQAAAAVKEVFDIAERMAALSEHDVVWVADRERSGREARVAPLTVAGLMRSRVFAERTTVLTSATLKLGGDFTGVAGSVGLREDERVADGVAAPEVADDDDRQPWRGIDVGSPFAYAKQGIVYLAKRMPVPGRDGITDAVLEEVAELVWAAGGRTLGLFSSRRAAETAAVWVRKQLPQLTVLCQGDAQLSELTRRFVAEEESSLFGTLSLWQGIDVPGDTCRLVIIDRIPFPRPDEPLTVARQRAVTEAGGNGFMSVAANHAALLLAQGSGRLIRRVDDRGVVAVLDPRLVTARYGSYLRASMPPMWATTDRETAIGALRRLAGST